MAVNTFSEVTKAKYVLLTTFTKDGRPKPTPIWIAPDGDRALVITEKNAWKVKRIRNTPRVTLAVCDMRYARQRQGRGHRGGGLGHGRLADRKRLPGDQ